MGVPIKKQPETSPTGLSTPHIPRALLGLLLFAAVLGTFWPAIHNDFIGYDDPVYVTGNGHVQQGLSWKNVKWAFAAGEGGNWHPLTWLSHMLDCELFGVSPSGHHFASILLHALNAALLFAVLNLLTGGKWRSLVVAGFFGLHPLRVESVAWVSERKDVLSGLFFMLTLLAYAKYLSRVKSTSELEKRKVQSSNSESPWLWYGVALILFALGLMSKPMLVTLPFILLLLDIWPLRRFGFQSPRITESNRSKASIKNPEVVKLLVEKIPFLVLAAITCVITVVVQRKGGAMSLAIPLAGRAENAAVSYCRYIGKTFYPSKLAFFYPYPSNLPVVTIALALLLLLGITVFAIRSRERHEYLLAGWLWFVGALVPVIGLVQVGEQALADRYTYIPSIGLFLALVWGAHELTRGWKFQKSFSGVLAAALTLLFAVKTREQLRVWKNNDALFTHAIAVTKNNYIAHNNLGVTYEQQGRLEEAAAEFRHAIAEKPDYARAHKNLGVVLERKGDSTKALEEYREAIRLDPNFAETHNALGTFLSGQNRLDEALAEFKEALRLKPDYADAHFNLGVALGRKGLVDAAIREYQATLEVEPNRAEAHNNLGVALDNRGQIDAAIDQYVAAIMLDPRYARARFNLGVALSRKGALAPAIEQFQEALKLKPDYAEARTNLNALLEMQNRQGK